MAKKTYKQKDGTIWEWEVNTTIESLEQKEKVANGTEEKQQDLNNNDS